MDHLKRKVDAGAEYICTQLFFDNWDFYDFQERCDLAGIRVPILAGIMPVTSLSGMKRMADLALGARFPAALQKAVARCSDDRSIAKVGIHWATEQCRDLLDHKVRGLHFYTLNKSDATRQIYENLGRQGLAGPPGLIRPGASPLTDLAALTDRLKGEARRLGFDLVGVAPAVVPTGYGRFSTGSNAAARPGWATSAATPRPRGTPGTSWKGSGRSSSWG